MKRVTTIVTACAAAALLTLTIGVAAQDFNPSEKTFMTFSGPVELPGLRLEGGTYVFRLADTAGRNVVQVLTQDEMDILGQWLFVQAERPDVSAETVVTFRETSPGATPAVQYWYYPGEKIGKEFIYPKDQAMRIAARTGQTVQTDEGPVTVAEAQASAIEGDQTPAPVGTTGVVEGSGLPASDSPDLRDPRTDAAARADDSLLDIDAQADVDARSTQAVGTSGADDQAGVAATTGIDQESTMARADTLPATASPLALGGLLGLLSLAGAAGIRFFRG